MPSHRNPARNVDFFARLLIRAVGVYAVLSLFLELGGEFWTLIVGLAGWLGLRIWSWRLRRFRSPPERSDQG